MKYRHIAALLAVLALAACKKDDADSTLPTLSGITVTHPTAYLATGSSVKVVADIRDIQGPTGQKPLVGIYWQLNGEERDTVKVDGQILYIDLSDKNLGAKYESEYKERLSKWLNLEKDGEYSLYCYAFPKEKDFYGTSDYCKVYAVDPATVVSGVLGMNPVEFGDQRYWTITAGGKTWTANNLYDPSAGLSFRDCQVLDRGMGRLYSWEEARNVCPSGWHLPTAAEFATSFGDAEGVINAGDLIVDARFQDREMWTYNADVHFTNTYGFNAIPAGYVDKNDPFNTWDHYGHYAFFWTADESDGMGTYLYLYDKHPEVRKTNGDKNTLYLSVRCVQD